MVRLTGVLEVTVAEARKLVGKNITSPYCIVELVSSKSSKEIGKTIASEEHCNPKWSATFYNDIDTDLTDIRFIVKDRNLLRDEKIGTCSVDASTLGGTTYMGILDLVNKKGVQAGKLHIKIKFSDAGVIRRSCKFDKVKGCVSRKINDECLPPSERLHGTLNISVVKAEKLPNLDSTLLNRKNKSDPFVMVGVTDMYGELFKLSRTSTIDNNLNPEWNENFCVKICHDVAYIVFTVYDEDVVTNDKMCAVEIPVNELMGGRIVSGEKELTTSKNKAGGTITISAQFLEYSVNDSPTVEKCCFSPKQDNKIKLYQDAKSSPLSIPVSDHSKRPYVPKDAWQDIEKTLTGAKKFICIAGWCLNAGMSLTKKLDNDSESIGKILLNKSEEGVDVRILLWDDADSNDAKKDTAKVFFKESLVKVDLVPRKKSKKEHFFKDSAYTKHCFSHNQKFIVADEAVEESPGLRNIVAYVGCFDLTNGHFDTPEHHLPNGDSESRNQITNIIANLTKSPSKHPWHEVYCKVIGKTALDIFENFKLRWEAEGLSAESDFDLHKNHDIYTDYTYDALDSWDVQLFQSICEDSVALDDSDQIFYYGGTRTDDSIYRAYIHQIQRAKRFIYIETSNFMGSSHFWDECCDIQLKNLIPIEITMKIVKSIKQRKHFRVYINMSMHPENNPEDQISQEILHWQYHTMDMMYRRIASAIRETGINAQPQDYLLFLCLGKREECECPLKSSVDSHEGHVPTKQKRSSITINSKFAIFDDEYIIVGSANINDRAMVGNRNTELAIGAHQPRLASVGDVSIFRKCLWVEHMGGKAPVDLDPANLECIRKVRDIGEMSLRAYIDINQPLSGVNLLAYPVMVEQNGSVTVRSDCEKFPDTKAFVLGARSKVVPTSVTS